MSRGDTKRLNDIRRMCATAAEVVRGGREAAEADEARWLGLERCVEIAGEAATQLSDETRMRYPDVAWRELIAVRVVLAHANHRVDSALLWDIVSTDFPRLAKSLGPPDEIDSP